MTRSRKRSSTTFRFARRRPTGIRGSSREASATCDPYGRRRTIPASASSDCFASITWTSSSTSTNGRARRSSEPRSTGSTSWRTDEIDASSRPGSLSPSSSVTQANGLLSCSAHWERIVVFPYPAGATSRARGTSEDAIKRRRSRERSTSPSLSGGRRSLDSSTDIGRFEGGCLIGRQCVSRRPRWQGRLPAAWCVAHPRLAVVLASPDSGDVGVHHRDNHASAIASVPRGATLELPRLMKGEIR